MNLLVYLIFNFIIYSFIGWIIEGIYSLVTTRNFRKEGFLVGPVKPMYGIAVTLLILFKDVFRVNNILFLFLCFLIPSSVEYISGYILRHVFNKDYWDYSKMKYNIDGLVTIRFSMYWMMLSYIGINLVQPYIYRFYTSQGMIITRIVTVSIIILLLDLVFTLRNFKYAKAF